MEDKFTKIYDKSIWGKRDGKGTSGTGSNISYSTKFYIKSLMKNIEETGSKNICDIGCGDWEFSQTIDWKDLNYTGIDCVKSVIDDNNNKYSSENIKFIHKDAGQDFVPKGFDFVIIKDVIQHWDNEEVLQILPQIINNNKFVFLINGYIFGRSPDKNNWTERTLDKIYKYHPIDIHKKPLNEISCKIINEETYRCKQFVLIQK
jgi:2-polyprenyl-3-methyl-5-hydroxy-6-metoxy-1,4-benzoquinol methylase